MTSPKTPNTLPDITEFVRALAQLASANPHQIDFTTTTDPTDHSIIFSTKHNQLPKIPHTPQAPSIIEPLLRRHAGKFRVDGRENYRANHRAGLQACVTSPEGTFQTMPEQSWHDYQPYTTVPVHMAGISALLPRQPVPEIEHTANGLVRTFRHLDTKRSTPRIRRYHLHRVMPEYILEDDALQRTRFLLRGDSSVLAALHPEDATALERQGDEQLRQYVAQTLANYPGCIPQHLEHLEHPDQPPGEFLIFNITQHGVVHADLAPGVKPVELHEHWDNSRAEYVSLVRAVNLDDSLPYVVVFNKADNIFKRDRERQRPYLELNETQLIDHDGNRHEIAFGQEPRTRKLPNIRYQNIMMTATIHHLDESRELIFVNTDLMAFNEYDEPEAAITTDYSGNTDSLASFIFGALWDYDQDHGEYEDSDIMQQANITAVRLLEGNQHAFVAELQHLADNFSPTARRPNEPVTVTTPRHSITWNPL